MNIELFKNKLGQTIKCLRSEDYNYDFNMATGFFARWGKTPDEDPQQAPFPEILDIELSAGECSGRCAFCYKKNGAVGGKVENMTLDQFKIIVDKMPWLTQIAAGILDIDSNPDFMPMMEYARSKGIIPNYTCNGNKVTDDWAQKTASVCGAVAVSIVNKEHSYNSIQKFIAAGMKQVNIHSLLSLEGFEKCKSIVTDIATDPRLKGMNAIVFLQYKHKNPNSPFHSMLDPIKYRELVEHCEKLHVNYGFDSCSAGLFLKSVESHPKYEDFKTVSEACESSVFSGYCSCKGIYYPCSFCEGMGEWKEGLDILNCNDFVKDIWNHEKTIRFRENLLKNNRNCPIYDI